MFSLRNSSILCSVFFISSLNCNFYTFYFCSSSRTWIRWFAYFLNFFCYLAKLEITSIFAITFSTPFFSFSPSGVLKADSKKPGSFSLKICSGSPTSLWTPDAIRSRYLPRFDSPALSATSPLSP